MIPKIIHYIWLGGKEKPPLLNICILSWREKLPDYEIVEWNESNLDLDRIAAENRFFSECRKRGMKAYMSDYLRLLILYKHGGIYLDTDMQVIKSLDPLLFDKAFVGADADGVISCGIIASEKKNPQIQKIITYYSDQIWQDSIFTIPRIMTKVIGGEEDNWFKVYPAEYFYPFPFQSVFDSRCIQKNTFAVHWWAGSWNGKIRTSLFLNTKHIHNPITRFFVSVKKTGGFLYRSLSYK
jgi:mannosyltransferase OCH1-like enzyme